MDIEKLRYPIGKFEKLDTYPQELIQTWIREIELFPRELRNTVENLKDNQLDTVYRPGGWTVRQVVHHCADSHMNSFIRFKLALTEDTPVIKPYLEEKWAELEDSTKLSPRYSLDLLDLLHSRWIILLRSLDEKKLDRNFIHPSSNSKISLRENIGLYAWHGKHHLAQIISLNQRMGW